MTGYSGPALAPGSYAATPTPGVPATAVVTVGAQTVRGAKDFVDRTGHSEMEFQVLDPPAAPTVAVGAAGALTGAYTYRVTFRTPGGLETCVGAASAVVNPAAQRVELTNIPVSTSTRVSSRRIYRTKAGQVPASTSGIGPAYFLVATIANNVATTYSDNATDASLGAVESGIRSNTTGAYLWITGHPDPTQPLIDEFQAGHIGWSSSAFGRSAMDTTQTGAYVGMDNNAFGAGALNEITSGNYNVGVGASALQRLLTGSNNVGIGNPAGDSLTSGNYNVAIGSAALHVATTPSQNVAIGGQALYSLVDGSYNVGIGMNAGVTDDSSKALTGGYWNTFIGTESGPSTAVQLNRQTAIGYRAKTAGTNATAIGVFSSAGAAGAVAIGCDSAGTGATTATADEIKLGTAVHTLNVIGNAKIGGAAKALGFYGSAGVAKQVGVTVDAAGIHAALVALNLIAA